MPCVVVPKHLELAASSRFGRSLRATKPLPVGEVVLRDTPLIAWRWEQGASLCATSLHARTLFLVRNSSNVCDVNAEWASFAETAMASQNTANRDNTAVEGCGAVLVDEWLQQLNEVLMGSTASSCYSLDGVPMFMRAAALAYCTTSLPDFSRDVWLDMHVPDLPLRSSLLELVSFCTALSAIVREQYEHLFCSRSTTTTAAGEEGFDQEQQVHIFSVSRGNVTNPPQGSSDAKSRVERYFSPHALLHAVMAAMVNAHRGPIGEWCLYPLASKLAHSCDPNTMFMSRLQQFVAIRSIREGEFLSFSYVGGPLLVQSSYLRQKRLLESHLFVCSCPRCRGPDVVRALPATSSHRESNATIVKQDDCATDASKETVVVIRSTPSRLVSEADCISEGIPMWVSKTETLSDEKQHPHTNNRTGLSFEVSPATLELESVLVAFTRGLGTTPYRLQEMTTKWNLAMEQLSPLHWTFAVLLWHIGSYFSSLIRTHAAARKHAHPTNNNNNNGTASMESQQETQKEGEADENDLFCRCAILPFLLYYRWTEPVRVGEGGAALLRLATVLQIAKVLWYGSTAGHSALTSSVRLLHELCHLVEVDALTLLDFEGQQIQIQGLLSAAVEESAFPDENRRVLTYLSTAVLPAYRALHETKGDECVVSSGRDCGPLNFDEEASKWRKPSEALQKLLRKWNQQFLMRSMTVALLAKMKKKENERLASTNDKSDTP